MSTKAVGWALDQEVGNAVAKLVLVGFAEHAHPVSWVAWPARSTVGAYAEVDPRTVSRVVTKLEAGGFIREVQPGELDDEDRCRFETIPADRRPRLWLVAPNGPGGHAATPRVDNLSSTGGQTGRQAVHQNKTKPEDRTARVAGERRDYLDADATQRLLDEQRATKPDPDKAGRLRRARGTA